MNSDYTLVKAWQASQVSHMDLAMESCKSSSSVTWSLYFLKDIGSEVKTRLPSVARSDKWTASKNKTPEEEAKVIFSVSAQTWNFMESILEERETDAHHVTFHWHKWACLDVLALRSAASPGQIMHRFSNNQCHQATKTHPKHHVIEGSSSVRWLPPPAARMFMVIMYCPPWNWAKNISGNFTHRTFSLANCCPNLYFLVWTWLTFRSPKPQAHSASLASTLKSPGRQDFVPKNLGVSLASRWSRLLSHLLSSLDVLWKLAGFPVGSSKKFLSNRWLKNGNKTCHSP